MTRYTLSTFGYYADFDDPLAVHIREAIKGAERTAQAVADKVQADIFSVKRCLEAMVKKGFARKVPT
jgi:hypothetical protein